MSQNTKIIEYFNKQMKECQKYNKLNEKGKVRSIKGNTVEELTKIMIKKAWSNISEDTNRLTMNSEKIPVKNPDNRDEFLKISQDIHVFIDKKFCMSFECKSYTEVAMYKRILTDCLLLSKVIIHNNLQFFLIQLENFLGGDYGDSNNIRNPSGSASVKTLDAIFYKFNKSKITILTLTDGNREIERPIHTSDKELNPDRIEYAIEKIQDSLSMHY